MGGWKRYNVLRNALKSQQQAKEKNIEKTKNKTKQITYPSWQVESNGLTCNKTGTPTELKMEAI